MSKLKFSRHLIALVLSLTTINLYELSAFADLSSFSPARMASLTVSGEVDINGIRGISGSTIFSGSAIGTGINSYATIDLMRVGRFESQPNTNMTLDFDERSGTCQLRIGVIRIYAQEGAVVNVTTKDGTVLSRGSAAVFTVETGDDGTLVDVESGDVELHSTGGMRLMDEASVGQQEPGSKIKKKKKKLTIAEIAAAVGAAVLIGVTGGVASPFIFALPVFSPVQ